MATPFHSRADWGARPPKTTPVHITSDGLTAHYGGDSPWGVGPDRSSAERFRDTTDHNRCATIVRGWQNFHMDGRGWNDIAYNALVCPHGHRYEGRGPGIRSGANGTNIGNARSEAVVYIAGGTDPLTDEAKRAYLDEETRFGRELRWNHSNWKSTSCAGPAIKTWQAQGWSRPMSTTSIDEGDLSMGDITKLTEQLNRIEQAVVVDISLDDQVEPGVSTLLELAARTDRNVTDTVNELFHGPEIDRVETMPDTDQRKRNFWGLMAGGVRLAATEDKVAEMDKKLDAIMAKLGIDEPSP